MATVTGSLAISAAKARDLVAQSSTFQGETGSSESEATDRVWFGSAPPNAPRPFAVIRAEGSSGVIGGGSRHHSRPEGVCDVHIERDVPADVRHDESRMFQDAQDWFGSVVDEMRAVANGNNSTSNFEEGHLPGLQFDVRVSVNDPMHAGSLGRFAMADVTIQWGDG